MLFVDILEKHRNLVLPEMDTLFKMVLQNQRHPNDLLIILLNGIFDDQPMDGMSPYVIGPGIAGLSEGSHYNFIHFYRSNSIYDKNFNEYIKEVEYDPERSEERDQLIHNEELTIHMEMLVYLKIWEMTQFLKNWYQLVRLLKGENYEWHFKLKVGEDNTGIATAQEMIRVHIRDEIQQFSQEIYNELRIAYKSQIRNSIAHSNYSFQGRNIHPNNANPNANFPQITNVPFNEWIEMIHATFMLHDSFIYFKRKINEHFAGEASRSNNSLDIRVNKADGTEELRTVRFRSQWNDWRWA
jgi:hypothetical protein